MRVWVFLATVMVASCSVPVDGVVRDTGEGAKPPASSPHSLPAPRWPWKGEGNGEVEKIFLEALRGNPAPLLRAWPSLSARDRTTLAQILPLVAQTLPEQFLERLSTEEQYRVWALEALSIRRGSIQPVLGCAREGDGRCVLALARLPVPEAVQGVRDLVDCFVSGRRPVPEETADAIVMLHSQGRISAQEARTMLKRLLAARDLPGGVRARAATRLRRFRTEELLDFMARFRDDPSRRVARAVRRSMYLMGR